jgi:pimeloyl-ACP methyl ester carboxylesterase
MGFIEHCAKVVAIAAAAAIAGCARQDPATSGRLELKECRVAGVDRAALCGTLPVPENRHIAGGREIPIHVVVLPATSRAKQPDPIFWFAGGPSQAASDFARPALSMLAGLASKRDIVLVDQRGTGKSNGLHCRLDDLLDSAQREVKDRARANAEALKACMSALSERADLTQYTTTHAMADIDAVRAALGVERINLWGGSYGTRAAQEYLRRYPRHVRSVVLDGVVPPTLVLGAAFATDAAQAWRRTLEDCGKDPVCRARHPDLDAGFVKLLGALRAQPRRLTLADPLDGQPREVVLDDEVVKGVLFTTLYVPEALALVPHMIQRAQAGDFAPMAALATLMAGEEQRKNGIGMRLSVICAEDIPRLATARGHAQSATNAEPFGEFFVREFLRACEGWPRGEVREDYFAPLKSDVPVLLLSGALDPVTPPAYGEDVRKSLPRSLHLVAPNLGHGVSSRGCAPKLIRQFVENASVDGLDGECLKRIPRPTFFEPAVRAGALRN